MTAADLDPAVYAAALADVRTLRPYGTQPPEPPPEKPAPVERDECGTRRGYRLHQKHGETTCQRCRNANVTRNRALGTGRAT